MMNDQLLLNFISLVTFDQKIRDFHHERESTIKERSNLELQRQTLIDEFESIKNKLHESKKDVDAKELVMKVFDQQEAEKKRRLEFVASPKEYSSLKVEIDAIHEKQQGHEQVIIDAWDKLDALQKKYTLDKVSYQDKIEFCVQKIQELNKKIESIATKIDEHEKLRVNFTQLVSAEILNNYEHMRGLVPNPVVPVESNSCSACFYPVPAQDVAVIKKGKLLPCKFCYRILYIKDASQE